MQALHKSRKTVKEVQGEFFWAKILTLLTVHSWTLDGIIYFGFTS